MPIGPQPCLRRGWHGDDISHSFGGGTNTVSLWQIVDSKGGLVSIFNCYFYFVIYLFILFHFFLNFLVRVILVQISPYCRIYASVNWINIGSYNGLSPVRCQAITWTNVLLLSTRPLGTNFSEFLIKIQNFSFMKMQLKLSSTNGGRFVQGGDELTHQVGQVDNVILSSLQTVTVTVSQSVCVWKLFQDIKNNNQKPISRKIHLVRHGYPTHE